MPEKESRGTQFLEVAEVVAPIGLWHNGHAIAFPFEHSANDRRTERRMVDDDIIGNSRQSIGKHNNQNKESLMEVNLNYKKSDNGKYGYVDNDGNWVIEPQFDYAEEFVTYDDTFNKRSITLALVQYENLWGVIKPDGSWQIEPIYEDFQGRGYEFVPTVLNGKEMEGDFNEVCSWMIAACLDRKYGILDIDGNWIIKPYFEDISFDVDDEDFRTLAFQFNADTSDVIDRYGDVI